ncbi:MAG: 4-(cytidine 5'-diphospho)-2-C-methyl-D-erythritol kinase [Bacteroidia bacterium]
MIAFPNAKINLGLRVLSKRIDGYHNIETVYYPVRWREALEIIPGKDSFKFAQTGLKVEVDEENNLCVKAWRLMKMKYKIPAVDMHLHKIIPMGAGLGGGSSDAAFTIKLLNKLFELKLTDEDFEEVASEIGSDCAFFIRNKPVLARGKGNVFSQIEIDISDFKIIIVKPEVGVITAEAYSKVIPVENESIVEIIKLKPIYWKEKLINDFENVVFAMHPEIEAIKNILYESGAIYASMSGSGSAVYGIFEKEKNINEIKFDNCSVWAGDF